MSAARVPTPLPIPAIAAFASLTLALTLLWAPRVRAGRFTVCPWVAPCGLAVAAALVGGVIDLRALPVLVAFSASCALARHSRGAGSATAHAVMLAVGAGLFLHAWPGFHNPVVIRDAVLGPESQPYTKYLNFDKGFAALLLLGIYAPDRTATDDGVRRTHAFVWRFVVLVAGVLALTLAAGYVRWDPKLPQWWAMWLWSMVFLTALPEEALFRGVAQAGLERALGGFPWAQSGAIAIAGALFGVAHAAGGPVYVGLATAAGVGYGWIYASTRSIAAATLAHAGLNAVHFLFFSYPALAAQAGG